MCHGQAVFACTLSCLLDVHLEKYLEMCKGLVSIGDQTCVFTECLYTVLEYMKTMRKEGSYFENEVLMKSRLQKKKSYY